jgi:hypothetical protein
MAALARWCGQPIGLTKKLADLARPQCGLSRLRETIRLSIWGHSWLA